MAEDAEFICTACNGSGEGKHDRSICPICHGEGVLIEIQEGEICDE